MINKQLARIFKHEKIRFAAVGAVNTAVDFGVLIALAIVAGWPVFLANIVSTSAALATSYVLNKNAVFRSSDKSNVRQIVLFVGVTLTGIWVLQGVVIALVGWMLYGLLGQLNDATFVLIGKIFATFASLAWNYVWYSRVVFPKQKKQPRVINW